MYITQSEEKKKIIFKSTPRDNWRLLEFAIEKKKKRKEEKKKKSATEKKKKCTDLSSFVTSGQKRKAFCTNALDLKKKRRKKKQIPGQK